jgi:hypothetical protein
LEKRAPFCESAPVDRDLGNAQRGTASDSSAHRTPRPRARQRFRARLRPPACWDGHEKVERAAMLPVEPKHTTEQKSAGSRESTKTRARHRKRAECGPNTTSQCSAHPECEVSCGDRGRDFCSSDGYINAISDGHTTAKDEQLCPVPVSGSLKTRLSHQTTITPQTMPAHRQHAEMDSRIERVLQPQAEPRREAATAVSAQP